MSNEAGGMDAALSEEAADKMKTLLSGYIWDGSAATAIHMEEIRS